MSDSVNQASGYGPIVADLARRAVHAARDAAPHRGREAQWRQPLTRGLPAARWLLRIEQPGDAEALGEGFQQLAEAATQIAVGAPPHFTDGFGHSRPIYHFLMLHLHHRVLRARAKDLPTSVRDRCDELGSKADRAATDPSWNQPTEYPTLPDATIGLWAILCSSEHPFRRAGRLDAASEAVVADTLAERAGDGSLHPQYDGQTLEEWTYRELVGLHALDQLARLTGRSDWQQAVDEVAAFHQAHTQPDYTTYQPWALAAFATRRETGLFAEQQLHDVTVHLSTGGPAAALVPALLLAEAAASLA